MKQIHKPLFIAPIIAIIVAAFVGLLAYQGPAVGQAAGNVNSIAPLTRDIGKIVTLTAQGAGTVVSPDQSGFNVTRVICVFVQTTTGGTPSTTYSIQNKDAFSGNYYTILTSPAITANSTNFIAAGGDLANAANSTAAIPIARTWRVSTTVGGTTPAVTASIGCSVQ